MNKSILSTGVQHYIKNNLNTDIVSVLLKKPVFSGISQKELAQQLEAKKKCEKKLPTWFETPKIYYPKKLNIEQSSSEKTASYKSQIIKGKTIIDLTGGFGVDSYFFSKVFDEVFYHEIEPELAEITAHNFKILKAENINVSIQDGISYSKKAKNRFDWIYLDPSRRDDIKGKVFRLKDCSPNILEHLDGIFEKSDNILIKTSPLIDLSQGIKELNNVFEVHVVAVNNEVKELLWVLRRGFMDSPSIKTLNIKNVSNHTFNFDLVQETLAVSDFSIPLKYLYEPNAAILKSGAFKLIGSLFSLKKLHAHTHLYTANQLVDFPGRRFKIEMVLDYGKKTRVELGLKNANVAIRNFPRSVDFVRKKLKLKDGGERYIFFTKDVNNNLIVLKCSKINL